MEVSFKPVWFDSFGAKSSCTLVKTPDVVILVDPGAAVMQPSFPASWADKIRWLGEAEAAIRKAGEDADVVVVTHYHYDHYTRDPAFYEGKVLLAKNPNEYINDSQRKRAERFFRDLWKHFLGKELEEMMERKEEKEYPNPLDELKHSMSVDFGDYAERRQQLLKKGVKWFRKRVKNWNSRPKIPELESENLTLKFADGKSFKFGSTHIRCTRPLFHGIEFSRVGWVFALTVQHGNEKLLYSSDLDGPIIEDYADWIIRENPNVLILDGPMTYMFGYLLTRTTLNRVISNVCRIIEETDVSLVIFDHHLPREPKFKQRLRSVYELAAEKGKKVVTAAEYLGRKPKVLELVS